jgi:hypothetical protein
MYNKVLKKNLVLGIILPFIVISVSPLVIGNNVRIKNELHVTFSGEPPCVEFNRTYGYKYSDTGESARQTNDGGYIIVGDSQDDALLIKTDVIGNEEWQKFYGGNNIDSTSSIELTNDGGYIFVGNSQSYGAKIVDLWLVKTDANGTEMWNNIYGGRDHDHGHSVKQTEDGGFVATGYTKSFGTGDLDILLVKTDSNGVEKWIRTYGGKDDDRGWSVDTTNDGGFILTGLTCSYGIDDYNLWLVKTDGNGTEMWNRTYGSFGTLSEGSSVMQTNDYGYIVTGYKQIPGKGYIVSLWKTDSNGFILWNRTFFEPQKGYVYVGEDVKQTKDGGYIIVGHVVYGYYMSYLIKTDENGSKEWVLIFEEYDLRNDLILYSVQQTKDGGFILGGHRDTVKYHNVYHDFWLVKVGHVPDVEITKPENAIYLFYQMRRSFFWPIIIGPINVEVEASDDDYDIERVSFYVDDVFQADDTSEPYSWKWNKPSLFRHTLKAVAFNSNGNVGIEEIVVSKFF